MKKFTNVTADSVANIYFDGKVVSHAVYAEDGSKKTLGVIFPGDFRFDTEAAEIMEISAGSCEIVIDGTDTKKTVSAGEAFNVDANSGFTIAVKEGVCQYICSYIKG
ncbi:pyrimidine/purine nucleoside phosphorylase [Luteolibacter algae]|uniref:Pyrimidine/purine nucleoside phosphorylase n=1 Tax=Luteolibacter algae TaxID=454151 RepID=A0ABW5D8Z5_9BACT